MVLQCNTNIQIKLKLPLIVFSSCCLLYVVLLMPKPRITKQTRSVSEREELVSGVVSKACRLELGQCGNRINQVNRFEISSILFYRMFVVATGGGGGYCCCYWWLWLLLLILLLLILLLLILWLLLLLLP